MIDCTWSQPQAGCQGFNEEAKDRHTGNSFRNLTRSQVMQTYSTILPHYHDINQSGIHKQNSQPCWKWNQLAMKSLRNARHLAVLNIFTRISQFSSPWGCIFRVQSYPRFLSFSEAKKHVHRWTQANKWASRSSSTEQDSHLNCQWYLLGLRVGMCVVCVCVSRYK